MFSLAGIWAKYEEKDREIHTFVILTMKPNEKMSEVHDRMPVILRKSRDKEWINGSLEKSELHKYPSKLMTIEKVSKKVNDPSNDSKNILTPDSTQTTL